MKKLLFLMLLASFMSKAQTYYISNTGNDNSNGTSTSTPWKTLKTFQRGKVYNFKRGDTFYIKVPSVAPSGTTKVEIGAFGTGSMPFLTVLSQIKSSAWALYSTNVWMAQLNSATYVTGFLSSNNNPGYIKTVDSIYGERRSKLTGLVKQWQFYYDFLNHLLYVYSTANPSTLSTNIWVSNDDKIINLSDYEYIHDIKVGGTSQAGLLTDQPVNLKFSYVHVEEVGGKFKSLSDSLREGAGISFYNGATNDTVDHCYVKYAYECAYTMQTHSSGATPILYSNILYLDDSSYKCESSLNPSIAVPAAHGFYNCLVDSGYFSYDGYSWAHPPVKPTDNQSVSQLNNFWQGIPSENDLIVQHCTYYAPRGGLIFMSGSSATVPWTQRNNHIWLDSGQYIRKNTAGGAIKWPYRFMVTSGGGYPAYVTASGSEVGSDWNCLNCYVVGSHTYYRDVDGDGFGNPGVTSTSTVQPSGYVNNNTDCNDADATINPSTKWYLDLDGDGYYTNIVISCTSPGTGYYQTRTGGGDCDDNNAAVHPGATEVGDGIDNNCNGFIDEGTKTNFYIDADGDGYGSANAIVQSLSAPAGYVDNNTDCDDNNSAVNPGATEICGNGIDDNCNGQIDEGCGTNPTISIADTTVAESAGQVSVRIYLSATSSLTTKVDYYTIDGTATFPRDFKQAKGTATIAAGSLSTWITINISKDKILEPTEVFSMLLQNPVNATISDNKGDISITNSP
jgi:hypothetical protein